MNNNHQIFFYGMWAKIEQFLGACLIVIGLFAGIITSHIAWFIILGIIGIILIIKGKADRFDYQRQSGHIMHGGDGWK